MHALIVVSHPVPDSLTHTVARHIAEGVIHSGVDHSVEIADLYAEGFDPRFAPTDMSAFNGQSTVPQDVIDQQTRINRADTLVLVYPIYWWSMPGQLKGWIDRVFSNGWAYEDNGSGKVGKKLQHLNVHLVALGGADIGTFTRHGYLEAMKTQIDHGIFDYCGAPVVTSTLLHSAEPGQMQANFATATAIGSNLFASHKVAETCV